MTFEQQWIEFDYNPFILFSANGKILSLNAEAQYLMGAIENSTIFELAKTYASQSFGFNTTFINLEFGRFKFFGLTVGYENEDEIGIRLYQSPSFRFGQPKEDLDLVNIYTLIELSISSNSINNAVRFEKEFDPSVPEIRLQTDIFIKMLNKIYTAMITNEIITTRLYYRIGEHIKYEGKKYTLIAIELGSKHIEKKYLPEIKSFAAENNIYLIVKEKTITVNVPMIVQ